jgi:tetratricopeptide (TPR) repeat protein
MALDFLIDWSLLAIGIMIEKPDQFVSMPVYHDLLDVMDSAPEEFQYKRGRVYLQMATHFRQWLEHGGVEDELDAEDAQLLNSATEAAEAVMEEFLEVAEAREKFEEWVAGHRALLRYYLLIKKPNDAVAQLKAIMEILPRTPDYHPSQLAETQILLGQLFSQFAKWQTARKYFDMARETFEELGEEFEMHMYQAEGWMEECDKHLS